MESSYCGTNACVEVAFVKVGVAAAKWRRAGQCSSGSCVEVRTGTQSILVRDSKDPSITPLSFTPDEWKAFVTGVKNGEFDI